jgi:hypothetical protein
MVWQAHLLLAILAKYSGKSISYCKLHIDSGVLGLDHCCPRKIVGEEEYTLVKEEDTTAYNCSSDCIYENVQTPGSRICFKDGALPVQCQGKPSYMMIMP